MKINEDVKAVILAAGKGTRMKSDKPKVLHEIFSKPLLGWVIDCLVSSSINENIVVTGHKSELVEDYLKQIPNTVSVLQKEQKGTGHAVSMVKGILADFKGILLVVCGDTPLIRSESINEFIEFHKRNNAALTVMTTIFDNPAGYGRIVRDKNGSVEKIVEQKDADDVQKNIKEVNAGIYCINWEDVSAAFDSLTSDNAQGEYYLTDIVEWANNKGKKVLAYTLDDSDEIYGINSRENLAVAAKIMKTRKLKELMNEGVTIVDPDTTSISPETSIEEDTVIFPNTFINGKNKIGRNCKIGPFSHLRGECIIEDYVKIGNFVELKKAYVKSHTNISHLSYVGDATVGSNVNIGAGTITANYNSHTKVKSKTIISDGASVGSNTVLVAPVVLGKNAFIGAGSVITKNVDDNSLAITRSAQREIKNYIKNKGE